MAPIDRESTSEEEARMFMTVEEWFKERTVSAFQVREDGIILALDRKFFLCIPLDLGYGTDQELQIVFHKLWSRDGDPKKHYNKYDWKQLRGLLADRGIEL